MDIEVLKTLADNGVTAVLLGLFVWFFLTKFSNTIEKIHELVGKQGTILDQMLIILTKMAEKEDRRK